MRILLSTMSAGVRDRQRPSAGLALSGAVFQVVTSFGQLKLRQVWAFIRARQPAPAIKNLITALFLLRQFRVRQSRALVAPASEPHS